MQNDKEEAQVTHCLVFWTMAVGLNAIREDNAAEFFERAHILETINGPCLYAPGGLDDKPTPRPITLADVRRRVGLRTNAANMTRAAFNKARIAGLARDALNERRRQEATTTEA